MNSYGIVGAEDSEVDEAIECKYKKEPEKLTYAKQIAAIAGEYSRNLPVGFNRDRKNRRTYRRNAKREIYNRAKEEIKPVGFIASLVFWAILSGIVSWFVQRMLNFYFDESSDSHATKKMFCGLDTVDED